MDLEGRRVLLAVSGGIAAYKAGYVARALRERGAEVRATLTRAATRFVPARSFEALTGAPVLVDLFAGGGGVDHVALARFPEVCLAAPATAHLLARLALGLADDGPTTVLLATRAPLLLAPAMNDGMWAHPATQAHLATLKARGARILGPATGMLAEGYAAVGRMVEPEVLVEAVAEALAGA